MKNLFVFILSLAFISFTLNADAQKRKVRAQTVHKAKKAPVKKAAVKKAAVKKSKKASVKRATRKRVVRTRKVHHHYTHLPRRGAVVTTMNVKAQTFKFAGVSFRYHAGVWYKPRGAKWVVVRPANGVRIRVLPTGYRTCRVNRNVYYYHYGTYYVLRDKEYEVVDAPIGAEVDSLPDGYNTVNVGGSEYYELDDVYYMPSLDDNEEEILVVVKNPKLK